MAVKYGTFSCFSELNKYKAADRRKIGSITLQFLLINLSNCFPSSTKALPDYSSLCTLNPLYQNGPSSCCTRAPMHYASNGGLKFHRKSSETEKVYHKFRAAPCEIFPYNKSQVECHTVNIFTVLSSSHSRCHTVAHKIK